LGFRIGFLLKFQFSFLNRNLVAPADERPIWKMIGWRLDAAARAEIDRILREAITDPVGPEFMAPPGRKLAA
jgi:hypothetical protein